MNNTPFDPEAQASKVEETQAEKASVRHGTYDQEPRPPGLPPRPRLPHVMTVEDFRNIPPELQALDGQWVLWGQVPTYDSEGWFWTKAPKSESGRGYSWNDPTKRLTFVAAKAAYIRREIGKQQLEPKWSEKPDKRGITRGHWYDGNNDGVGIVLGASPIRRADGRVLFLGDIDHARAPDGTVLPQVQAFLDALPPGTYTAWSPSGNGIRYFLWAYLPNDFIAHAAWGDGCVFEGWVANRFGTVTGNLLPGSGLEVGIASPELEAWIAARKTAPAPKAAPQDRGIIRERVRRLCETKPSFGKPMTLGSFESVFDRLNGCDVYEAITGCSTDGDPRGREKTCPRTTHSRGACSIDGDKGVWACFGGGCGGGGGIAEMVIAAGLADDRAQAAKWLEETFPLPNAAPSTEEDMSKKQAPHLHAVPDASGGMNDFMAGVNKQMTENAEASEKKPSQCKQLIAMVEHFGIELCHAEGIAYARVPISPNVKAFYPLDSHDMRSFFREKYLNRTEDGVRSSSLSDAIRALEARAMRRAEAGAIGLRVLITDDGIHIDMCDEFWREIYITKDSWSVVPHRVNFRREKGMLPLPVPQPGGNLSALRPLVNLVGEAQDGNWALAMGWLMASVASQGPFPILAITGSQGCAKTTIAQLLRSIIDPNKLEKERLPKESRDVILAANSSYMLVYDNLSSVDGDWSDLLSGVSTGTGLRTKKNYENSEMCIFNVMRPLILTGIPDFAQRADLANRVAKITPPKIPSAQRQYMRAIIPAFKKLHPFLLGAVCDAARRVLRDQDELAATATYKPRMADGSLAALCAEPDFGVPAGTWAKADRGGQSELSASTLEHPLAQAVIALARQPEKARTMSELFSDLFHVANSSVGNAGMELHKTPGWPKQANKLRGELRRYEDALTEIEGITIEYPPLTSNREAQRVIIRRNRVKQNFDGLDDESRALLKNIVANQPHSNA